MQCEIPTNAVIGMALWLSGTMPSGLCLGLYCAGCCPDLRSLPQGGWCQHCTPSVLIPLRIALLLSILVFRVTVFLLGHTCPSLKESLVRPISIWKGAPLTPYFPFELLNITSACLLQPLQASWDSEIWFTNTFVLLFFILFFI